MAEICMRCVRAWIRGTWPWLPWVVRGSRIKIMPGLNLEDMAKLGKQCPRRRDFREHRHRWVCKHKTGLGQERSHKVFVRTAI